MLYIIGIIELNLKGGKGRSHSLWLGAVLNLSGFETEKGAAFYLGFDSSRLTLTT